MLGRSCVETGGCHVGYHRVNCRVDKGVVPVGEGRTFSVLEPSFRSGI